jgi:hypothetical protein
VSLKSNTTIKIALFGLDKRSTAKMTTIFKINYKGRCEVAKETNADLAIIDVDCNPDTWESYKKLYPNLPAIVMSETPVEIKEAVYVAKPAKLDQLWEVILKLVTGIQTTSMNNDGFDPATQSKQVNTPIESTTDSSNISNTANAMNSLTKSDNSDSKSSQHKVKHSDTSLFYVQENYLLGKLLSTLRDSSNDNSFIYVKCWSERSLILDTKHGFAYTDLNNNQLKNLGVARIDSEFQIEIKIISHSEKSELSADEIKGLDSSSIDCFIWELALRTSRGRVPQGIDLSLPHYIQHWPNFTRLPLTPHSMRITSLWVDNPLALDILAEQLDIEKTDVYSFYSAAAAIGIAGPANRQVDSLISSKQIPKDQPTKRGMLASILRHMSK